MPDSPKDKSGCYFEDINQMVCKCRAMLDHLQEQGKEIPESLFNNIDQILKIDGSMSEDECRQHHQIVFKTYNQLCKLVRPAKPQTLLEIYQGKHWKKIHNPQTLLGKFYYGILGPVQFIRQISALGIAVLLMVIVLSGAKFYFSDMNKNEAIDLNSTTYIDRNATETTLGKEFAIHLHLPDKYPVIIDKTINEKRTSIKQLVVSVQPPLSPQTDKESDANATGIKTIILDGRIRIDMLEMSSNFVHILENIQYVVLALLGAVFSIMYKANLYVVTGTFDKKYVPSYWSQLIMGVIAGYFLANFIPDDGVIYNNLKEYSKPTLAVLGGFSAELVYRILNRLVDALQSIFKGTEQKSELTTRKEIQNEMDDELRRWQYKAIKGLSDIRSKLAAPECTTKDISDDITELMKKLDDAYHEVSSSEPQKQAKSSSEEEKKQSESS